MNRISERIFRTKSGREWNPEGDSVLCSLVSASGGYLLRTYSDPELRSLSVVSGARIGYLTQRGGLLTTLIRAVCINDSLVNKDSRNFFMSVL